MNNSSKFGAVAALLFAAAAFAQPANDNCGDAIPLLIGDNDFDNSTATLDGDTPCGFNNGKDIWYSFTPPNDGSYTFTTCNRAFFDTVLTAYDSCGGSVLACNDDACGLQSTIILTGLTAGVPVTIRLASYNDNPGGAGQINVRENVSSGGNDNCADATPLALGLNDFDSTNATTEIGAPCGAGGTEVWFTFTTATAGSYTFTTCDLASFDTVLTAYDSCGGSSLACNDDSCGLRSRIVVDVAANVPVYISVGSFAGGAGGTGQINVTANTPPANDLCADAIVAVEGDNAFDNSFATTDGSASCGFGGSTGFRDVWYTFTPATAGDYRVTACNLTFLDTIISAYDACGGNEIACNDDTCGLQSRIELPGLAAGVPVLIRIADYSDLGGGAGTFRIETTVSAQWNETIDGGGDAGDLPSTAQIPTGEGEFSTLTGALEGTDADMYRIRICDAAGFSASTVSEDTTGDTQIWLFDEMGMGVQFNDDSVGLQAAFGAEFVTAPGIYHLAISQYNYDAVDESGNLIWNNTPFNGVRAPDGPGAGSIVAGWTGATGGLSYAVTMTGVCFAGGGCLADFNGDQVVDFFDYLDFVQAFSENAPEADFNNDDVIDFFDYLDFVQAFSEGC